MAVILYNRKGGFFMAQNNISVPELTALIENIVTQVLNKSFGGQLATWAATSARTSLYLSRENGDRDWGTDGQLANDLYKIGQLTSQLSKSQITDLVKSQKTNLAKLQKTYDFGEKFTGVAGIAGAYQSGDALSGALSGAAAFGPWGAVAGLLAGLFSPGIDRWQRPKFKDAKQAFDKLFTMDRGERDEYYLPDSFYFRSGGNIPRSLVVRINDKKFDDYVGESLTNKYADQLQRGLVF